MNITIDKGLAIRAASILYRRWMDAPLPGAKTIGGMNPVYVCGIYLASVAKITGLSCGRINEDSACSGTEPGIGSLAQP